MTEDEYRTALEEYKYYYGNTFLVSDKKVSPDRTYPKTASEDPCGNGLLYLCMHMHKLALNGWLTEKDTMHFKDMIYKCQPKANGLVQRSPNKEDYQSHDDLIMLSYTLRFFEASAVDIYLYLENNHWVYNTQDPGKFAWKAWLGRFLHFKAHMIWCLGGKPNWLEKLVWKYTVNKACSKPKSDSTSWVLTWAMVEACHDASLQGLCADWRISADTLFEHTEGLFANALEAGHPIGKTATH